MHVVFVDTADWDYDIDAPLTRPIGGTQSAACYLMKALAARGVKVSFINNSVPYEKHGVRAVGWQLDAAALQNADYVVVVSDPRPQTVILLQRYVNANTKFLLWLHHAPDQPVVQGLLDKELCNLWDAVIYLSDWQHHAYEKRFPALVGKPSTILRNAIAPAFENLFGDLPVLAFKRRPPHLAYTSTPFRGLDRLLLAFRDLRHNVTGVQLNIYSSMQVYNVAAEHDPYAELYNTARQLPDVNYTGPLPQDELALQLRETLCLAYPNTFEETSCIAVMEAMAAGCLVITSNLGALPETLQGFGILTEFYPDAHQHAADFAKQCSAALSAAQTNWHTGQLEEKLANQVAWVNDNYTWGRRAAQWHDFFTKFLAK